MISIKSEMKKKLQILQNNTLKCALGLDQLTETIEVHRLAKLEKLGQRRKEHVLQLMFKQMEQPLSWEKKIRRRSGVNTRSGKKETFCYKED